MTTPHVYTEDEVRKLEDIICWVGAVESEVFILPKTGDMDTVALIPVERPRMARITTWRELTKALNSGTEIQLHDIGKPA